MEVILNYLEGHAIPWGIVTNKPTHLTTALLLALQIEQRLACLVCGDTLSVFKPDPQPLIYACQLLKQNPQDCLYVGDSATDVIAGKAAGIKTIVALYGYINKEEDPYSWQADGYIKEPNDMLQFLVAL
jgi:phosphoglycolate phosphatase